MTKFQSAVFVALISMLCFGYMFIPWIVQLQAQTKPSKPWVVVTLDGVCQHESHAHQDEDLRVRQSVTISEVDDCGFACSLPGEVLRIETNQNSQYTELLGLEPPAVAYCGRDHLRRGRLGLVWFCSYCHVALSVQLRKESKKK